MKKPTQTTKKVKKNKKVKPRPNWEQIIALSAAANYINNKLNKELEKVGSSLPTH